MERPDWYQQLREQGQSLTWLAERVGVSRQYLSALAAGSRVPSPELDAAIRSTLRISAAHRLDQAQAYAAWRGLFIDIRDHVASTLHGELDPQRVELVAEAATHAALRALGRITRTIDEA